VIKGGGGMRERLEAGVVEERKVSNRGYSRFPGGHTSEKAKEEERGSLLQGVI